MSLVERIKETEQKAEEIKICAEKEVEEMIAKANQENEELVNQMLAQTNDQIRKQNQETLEIIKNLEKKSQIRCEEICNQSVTSANNHLEETVEFIIKKVIAS